MASVEGGLDLSETGRIGTVLIAGPPACGKSTQCAKLLEKYGLIHVSAGDILRARRKYLPELANYMDKGLLVPDDLVCSIIKERLVQKDCQNKGVLLDGFPRTRKQAEVLAQMGIEISHMILLQVPDQVLLARVEGRRIDPVSGEVYNIKLGPPKDKEIERRLIIRTDDTREKMLQRLKTYHENIASIVQFYGSIVQGIDANKHPEQVFDSIRDILEGELYWGCVISREWPVRAYECSSEFDIGSNDIIATSRYVDHLTWLMLGRGVLADVRHPIAFQDSGPSFLESPVRFVVRAHSVEMHQFLLPGLRLNLTLWLQRVGTRSVTLQFAIHTMKENVEKTLRLLAITGQRNQYLRAAQQLLRNASVGDADSKILVATGTSTLVCLEKSTGKSVPVPQKKRLDNLVVQKPPGIPLLPVSSMRMDSMQDVAVSAAFRRPASHGVASAQVLVRPMDLGLDGFISPSTLIAYVEGVRSLSWTTRHSVRAVWLENLEKVNVGDHLDIFTWELKHKALSSGHLQATVFAAVEVVFSGRVVVRAIELLQPQLAAL